MQSASATKKQGRDLRQYAAEQRVKFKRSIPLLLMFLPAIAYFVIFKYVPMLGLQIAFRNYFLMDGIWKSPWVGLDNFRFLLSSSQTLTTIRNTFVLGILGVLVSFPIPIIIALLFNEVRSRGLERLNSTRCSAAYCLSPRHCFFVAEALCIGALLSVSRI